MESVTVKIALGNQSRTRAAGYREMTGEPVGQFVVHESHQRFGDWVVTHAPTGYAAAHGPSKASCVHAAKKLMALPVSWKFNRPGKAKGIRDAFRQQLRSIQDACSLGEKA